MINSAVGLWWHIALVSVVAVVLTTVALAAARPILLHCGIMDIPNHRSSHSKPTVRAGGLGIAVGFACAMTLAYRLSVVDGEQVLVIGASSLILAALGLGEDVCGFSIRTRLVGQLVVGGVLGIGLLYGHAPIIVISICGALATAFYVNVANFMDGVNSISSMHGFVGGVYFAVLGASLGLGSMALAGVVIAASFLAFLPWNAPNARMFMGDSGSYLLGTGIVGLCLWASTLRIPPFVAMAPLLIYSLDVVWTLIRRALKRRTLMAAHREHVYQRVQRSLDSHLWASGVCTVATLACCLIAFLCLFSSLKWLLVGVLPIAIAYLCMPAMRSGSNHKRTLI